MAVVLPAYNEEHNLTPLITQLIEVAHRDALALQVIVVDDGSTDRTAAELTELRRRVPCPSVVTHRANRGLAQALKSGIAAAHESGCEAAVFMDSDLSHRPEDLRKLVSALMNGGDVALGSRFVPGGGMEGVPLWRRLISRAGNRFGRRALGLTLTDLTFIKLMEASWLVLTDSGGVQEEAPVLGRPVLVLRGTTERPEAVECGVARAVGTDPNAIVRHPLALLDNPAERAQMARAVSPFGDGQAAQRIADILEARIR